VPQSQSGHGSKEEYSQLLPGLEPPTNGCTVGKDLEEGVRGLFPVNDWQII